MVCSGGEPNSGGVATAAQVECYLAWRQGRQHDNPPDSPVAALGLICVGSISAYFNLFLYFLFGLFLFGLQHLKDRVSHFHVASIFVKVLPSLFFRLKRLIFGYPLGRHERSGERLRENRPTPRR